MMCKESGDFEKMLSQLKNQVDEMSGSVLKLVDLSHSQEKFKRAMEYKMEILMNSRME
jgi:hypothetical protein